MITPWHPILSLEELKMKSKEKNDVVPYYYTLPMLQPDHKTEDAKVTIPQDDDVKITRGWSEDLKL